MNNIEEMEQSRQILETSIKTVRRNLDIYEKIVLEQNEAVLKNVGNGILNLFNRFSVKANTYRLEKELNRMIKEQEKLEEQIKKVTMLVQNQQERERQREEKQLEAQQKKEEKENRRSERKLNFKQGVKQKANSLFSRFGRVKRTIIEKLRLANLDVKLRNAFDNIKLFGFNVANSSMKGINYVKDGVVDFTSEQIAKYTEWRIKRAEEKAHNARLAEAERMSDMVIKERTKEHKIGMTEALNAQEREQIEIQNLQEQQVKDDNIVSERKLNFKQGVKPKTSSKTSRFGRVKRTIIEKLRLANLDVKLRNAFDNVKLFGFNMANSTMKGLNYVKNGVVNFTSEQIAKYTEWRIKRTEEKAHNARLAEAERMSNMVIKERTEEHKDGMIEALNAQEREQYNSKHEEYFKKKEELIQSFVDEKNKLLGRKPITR